MTHFLLADFHLFYPWLIARTYDIYVYSVLVSLPGFVSCCSLLFCFVVIRFRERYWAHTFLCDINTFVPIIGITGYRPKRDSEILTSKYEKRFNKSVYIVPIIVYSTVLWITLVYIYIYMKCDWSHVVCRLVFRYKANDACSVLRGRDITRKSTTLFRSMSETIFATNTWRILSDTGTLFLSLLILLSLHKRFSIEKTKDTVLSTYQMSIISWRTKIHVKDVWNIESGNSKINLLQVTLIDCSIKLHLNFEYDHKHRNSISSFPSHTFYLHEFIHILPIRMFTRTTSKIKTTSVNV